MNTLEHIGIQRWKLRNVAHDSGVPITEVNTVDDPESVILDGAQTGAVELRQPSENVEVASNKKNISSLTGQESLDTPHVTQEAVSFDEGPTKTEHLDKGALAIAGWQELADMLVGSLLCQSCGGTNPVLGDGDLEAKWVFVFDAPSAKDVSHQQLLSGRVGQLFDAILDALDLNRESVYLTSVFKCPASQDLSLTAQCGELVHRQLALIKPAVVITLGEFASQTVLRANENLSHLRSQSLQNTNASTLIAATYSLGEMLESPELKASVWQDLKNVMRCLES